MLLPLANLMCSPRLRCDYNRISEPFFLDIIYILCGFQIFGIKTVSLFYEFPSDFFDLRFTLMEL